MAKKGGISPTELLPGLKLYNSKGVESKKANLLSEKGILNFSRTLDINYKFLFIEIFNIK